MSNIETEFISLKSKPNYKIAYRQHIGTNGNIMFLHGFKASKDTAVSTILMEYCIKNNMGFTVLDLPAHGESEPYSMHNLTFDIALEACETILNNATTGKQLIVGASFGGWLMLHLSLRYPDKILGLIGMGSAPDFTLQKYSEEEMQAFQIHFNTKNEFITDEIALMSELVISSKKYALLTKDKLDIQCPIRLMHALDDNISPYSRSVKIVSLVTSCDAQAQLLNEGGHIINSKIGLNVLFHNIDYILLQHKQSKNI